MPFSFRSIINNGFGRKALKKHSISHFGILIARRYRIFWHLIRDPKNAPRLGSWIEGLIMEIFYESLENKTTTEIAILSSQSGSEELTFIIHIPVIFFNGRNHHFRCCDKAIIVFWWITFKSSGKSPRGEWYDYYPSLAQLRVSFDPTPTWTCRNYSKASLAFYSPSKCWLSCRRNSDVGHRNWIRFWW